MLNIFISLLLTILIGLARLYSILATFVLTVILAVLLKYPRFILRATNSEEHIYSLWIFFYQLDQTEWYRERERNIEIYISEILQSWEQIVKLKT